MVLDDVSDREFLRKMWMAARDGKDCKTLITSQMSYLCDAFAGDFVAIRMKNPSRKEARRILASLVGLENNTIPGHLLVIANKMIKATDGNPLALSCLATAFYYGQDKKGIRKWEDAWKGLSTQLGKIEKCFVLAQDDGIAPPRSLWSAMKLCIDSLENRDAHQILLLTYACEGGAVPEGVLRIMCAGLQMSSVAFNESTDELVMRELLKHRADTVTLMTNLGKELKKEKLQMYPSWCLQSLVKLYMERNVSGKPQMAAVISASLIGNGHFSPESIINSKQDCGTDTIEIHTEQVEMETNIAESDDQTRVRIALCALYFDRNHIDQGATRALIEACKRSNIDPEVTNNKLRKKAIEPLLWLLDKREVQFGEGSDEELGEGVGQDSDEELGKELGEDSDEELGEHSDEGSGEQWHKEDKCHVRKVLLQYICKRQLDAENISCLLKLAACPFAQLATLKALSHISSIEETPLLNENTISFLPAILDFFNLKEGFHKSVQEAASETLSNICWKAAYDKSALLLANLPGVLDVLMQSLDCKSPVVSQNAANSLTGLAFSADAVQEITMKQGILASLSNCLYDQSKPGLEITAAQALTNLTCSEDDSLKWRFISEEGALVGLVHCLSQHDNDDLLVPAVGALANLAAAKDVSLKLRIASEEGALVGLVRCLSKQGNDHLRESAAQALANLGFGNDTLRLRIASMEGALVGLVNCLSKHDNDKLQELAALALANLTVAKDDLLKLRIASEGALVGLVNCLSKHDNDKLRELAAGSLANLAGAEGDLLKLRISKEEGALIGLVHCLSKHDNDKLRVAAVRALANLAAAEDDWLKLRIACEGGALVGLVHCLSKHDYDDLLVPAVQALANLAAAQDDALKLRIASEQGVLVGLVHCLPKQDNVHLPGLAALALAILATAEDDALKLRIASEEGALVGLVLCLSKQDNDDLLESTTLALENLAAAEDDSLKLRIASEKGTLVGLVHCLSKHDNDDLRRSAALALANLAAAKDNSLKLRIASEKGTLVGLVHCLSKHDNDDLRRSAAHALANLAAAKDNSLKLRIASEEGALVGLVNCWSQSKDLGVQATAARAVQLLSRSPDARLILRGTEGLVQGLASLVGDDVNVKTRGCAVKALFNLDPTRAQEMGLLSAKLDVSTLSDRIFVKAELGDFEGALDDANEALERSDTEADHMKAFILQERGVLKRMMGDWKGALADLDAALKLEENDYELLKHRGHVKFLLNDVEGARADAEWALSRESSRSDSGVFLGGTAAEYLGYKL